MSELRNFHAGKIKKLRIDFYFAVPYYSYRQVYNENSNGLLRENFTQRRPIYLEDLLRAFNANKFETKNIFKLYYLKNFCTKLVLKKLVKCRN